MSPRNNSVFSNQNRRPSFEPPKPSFDQKTEPTISRTPSPTDHLMTEETIATPQRKKGFFSNLKSKSKARRTSSSRSRNGSLTSSFGSAASYGAPNQSRSSMNQISLNSSNHSSAAVEHLQGCNCDTDDDATAELKSTASSNVKSSMKSGVSDNTAVSNGGRPRTVRINSETQSNTSMSSLMSCSDSDRNLFSYTDQLYSAPNMQRAGQRRSHDDVIEENEVLGGDTDLEDDDNDEGGEVVVSRRRALSIASSASDDMSNELDERYESEALLDQLGDKPSAEELSNITKTRVNEVIQERSMADRRKFAVIPRYTKSDLKIEKHLGKGSFSDVFSVSVTIRESQQNGIGIGQGMSPELNNRIQARIDNGMRRRQPNVDMNRRATSGAFEYKPVNKSTVLPFKVGEGDGFERSSSSSEDDLDREINAKFGGGNNDRPSDDEEDLDKLIDAKFGPPSDDEDSDEDDLDKEIDIKFAEGNRSSSAPPPLASVDFDKFFEAKFGAGRRPSLEATMESVNETSDEDKADAVQQFKPPQLSRPPPRRQRRVTTDLGSSVCVSSLGNINSGGTRRQLAMKCLHPISRSNSRKFMIGVEDLVHETLLLSSFNHPHIIKLHGRAELSEGYFILLDKLKDTLDDRIKDWRKKYPLSSKNPPSLQQLKVATVLAETMAYLNDRNIVYRDLKPPNVGFDSMGFLKLFDFGFAEELVDDEPLEDRAGTVRYMAPEVGFDLGHRTPADVYSFTICLWEIFSLKKPFAKIKSTKEFNKIVFEDGVRPKLGRHWPEDIKEELEKGWSKFPTQRPSMKDFAESLKEWQRLVPTRPKHDMGQGLRASFVRGMSKRISWE